MYETADDLAGAGRMLENLSVIHRMANRPSEALMMVERTLAVYQQLGNADNQPSLYLNLGSAYRITGQYSEAIAAYSKGLSELGYAHVMIGQPAEAVRYLQSALDLFQQIGDSP